MMQRFAYLGGIGLKWFVVLVLLSFFIGSSVAFFLWSLDRIIELFWRHGWLLYLLPLAGLVSGWIYWKFGKDCEAGNSLIYSQIQQSLTADESAGKNTVPPRMSVLVLMGTLLTHLGGGSAGREGTAVQMGGSIASWFVQRLKLTGAARAYLLQAGVAAGFGAVFGTPLAAAVFAIEVVGLRLFQLRSMLIAIACAVVSDIVTTKYGIAHARFQLQPDEIVFSFRSMLLIAIVGLAMGLATVLFLIFSARVKLLLDRYNIHPVIRPVIGGLALVFLTLATGTGQYLGLGVKANPNTPNAVCLESSFTHGGADSLSWLSKLTFTSVTLGSGLKGGEATPLFFMGATLGNVLASPTGLPVALLAAIGLVAMFSSATRTPLACTLMAVELYRLPPVQSFQIAVLTLVACSTATIIRRRLHSES